MAVSGRLLIDQVAPGRLPYFTFFPAVILAAFFCGLWPSVVVLVLSAVAGTAWMSEHELTPDWRIASFFAFIAFAGLDVVVIHLLLQSLERVKHQEQQLNLLNKELGHRLKNLFTIANAVVAQTIRTSGPPDELASRISGRLNAIASAQDIVTQGTRHGVEVGPLIYAVVHPFCPAPGRFKVSGPKVVLHERDTTAFALMLHELSTNAVKHGAWSGETGDVVIAWSLTYADGKRATCNFLWREHDGPPVLPSSREGLGSKLIATGLSGATVRHALKPDGIECHINIEVDDEATRDAARDATV